MATLKSRRKPPELNKENSENYHGNNLAQNSNVSKSQEVYKTQVSEENDGRVTKKLSQEFCRTEKRILGPLCRLNDFLMNPLIQGHSRTTAETSRNGYGSNQGTNEDDCLSDLHPEASIRQSESDYELASR